MSRIYFIPEMDDFLSQYFSLSLCLSVTKTTKYNVVVCTAYYQDTQYEATILSSPRRPGSLFVWVLVLEEKYDRTDKNKHSSTDGSTRRVHRCPNTLLGDSIDGRDLTFSNRNRPFIFIQCLLKCHLCFVVLGGMRCFFDIDRSDR